MITPTPSTFEHGAPSMSPISPDDLWMRGTELIQMNDSLRWTRATVRAILNGGPEAVRVLLGDDEDTTSYLPVANLMLSGLERQAQRIGILPAVRVDPPMRRRENESDRRGAEKRERIIETYDRWSNLQIQQPQAARWLLGYGFVPYVVSDSIDSKSGQPFPNVEIRDPYNVSTAPWSMGQQPEDMLIQHIIPERRLKQMYPGRGFRRRAAISGGAVLLDRGSYTGEGNAFSGSNWANPQNDGIEVWEYFSVAGRTMFVPETRDILTFVPTPENVSRPFHIAKRFSFDRLVGQFDHMIGLMGMMARLNILAFISVMDDVFAETNVIGDMLGPEYVRGRFGVNTFTQGTRIEKGTGTSSFEAFQQIDRVERQARLVGAYPVTDDAQSPNSFVTGQGLRELTSSSESHDREYWGVIEHTLEELDEIRFRWAESRWGERQVENIYGEKFTPNTHIKGKYGSTRKVGLMAGLDSNAKTIGLTNLGAAGYLDRLTVMENLDGVDDPQKVLDRLREQEAEEILRQAMLAMMQGQPANPEVLQALIADLPAGDMRERYTNIFFPEAEAPLEQGPVSPQEPEPLSLPGETTTTMLARLTGRGTGGSGIQTVSQA